jgi:hypothetical protein
MDNLMEQQLWDYIDGTASAEERSAVEKQLADNRLWREKYRELMDMNELMKNVELEQPSLRFTRNVMEEIAKYHIAPATRKYINNRIIFSIAAFFITSIIGFVVYGIAQIDWSTGQSGAIKGIDFTRVDYSRVFNNDLMNIFMMANVVLGLMLLDRYLNNKRKKHIKEA